MSDSSTPPTDIPNVDDVPNVPVSKRPLPDPPGWSPTPLGTVSRGPLTLPYYVDPATSGPPDTYFLQCERLFRIHNVPRQDWVPLIVHQFIGCSRFVVERHFRSSVSNLPVDTTYQELQNCLMDFFYHDGFTDTLLDQFHSLRCLDLRITSFYSFIGEFWRLAERLKDIITERDVLTTFRNAFPPDVQQYIRLHCQTAHTWEDLLQPVQRFFQTQLQPPEPYHVTTAIRVNDDGIVRQTHVEPTHRYSTSRARLPSRSPSCQRSNYRSTSPSR